METPARATEEDILDTPPEVRTPENRTPENVDMRSASPVAGPSSSSAAPSSSAAGPSNPRPKTPVGQAASRGYLTTPTVVHCHNYMVCNTPVHMSTIAGGRNLQSSFGMNVATGRGIDGNVVEIDDHQEGIDSNEGEEEVEQGRQVQRQGQGPKRKRPGKGKSLLRKPRH